MNVHTVNPLIHSPNMSIMTLTDHMRSIIFPDKNMSVSSLLLFRLPSSTVTDPPTLHQYFSRDNPHLESSHPSRRPYSLTYAKFRGIRADQRQFLTASILQRSLCETTPLLCTARPFSPRVSFSESALLSSLSNARRPSTEEEALGAAEAK
jgi:hypothetical protein